MQWFTFKHWTEHLESAEVREEESYEQGGVSIIMGKTTETANLSQ